MLNESPSQDVQAQATKTIKLNMTKANTPEPKKVVSPLKKKPSKGEVKKAEKLEITFKEPSKKNSNEQLASELAGGALVGMTFSKDYESAWKAGVKVLQTLSSEGNMTAKLGIRASNASSVWEDRFKISAIALGHIANNGSDSTIVLSDLSIKMLEVTKDYEEGANIGYAILSLLGDVNNKKSSPLASTLINNVLAASQQGKYSEDVYKTIYNGLNEVKSFL